MSRSIQDVIDLILSKIPGAPYSGSVDVFKSGDPRLPVTGIVTTFIASMEVIEKAHQLGANLIITHEPTYYNHEDKVDWLEADPVYAAKLKLIEDNGICIWRFHDYWHSYQPDGVVTGFARKMAWETYRDVNENYIFRLPGIPLSQLVSKLKQALSLPGVRVVGNPTMLCKGVGALVGSVGGEAQVYNLQRPDIDTIICGETVEWQVAEYVRDSIKAGIPKALIPLGHEVSEEPGMQYLAEWLKALAPEVKITHVPAGDPLKVS
jgi:putative NIF3 family GTP cyclohydrolase 1 type 2